MASGDPISRSCCRDIFVVGDSALAEMRPAGSLIVTDGVRAEVLFADTGDRSGREIDELEDRGEQATRPQIAAAQTFRRINRHTTVLANHRRDR